jgi:hypothetical protein
MLTLGDPLIRPQPPQCIYCAIWSPSASVMKIALPACVLFVRCHITQLAFPAALLNAFSPPCPVCPQYPKAQLATCSNPQRSCSHQTVDPSFLELTFLLFVTQLQDGIIQLPPRLTEKTLKRGSCAVNTVDVIQDATQVVRAAPPINPACICPVRVKKEVVRLESPLEVVPVQHVVVTDSQHLLAPVVQDWRSLVESVAFGGGRNPAPLLPKRDHVHRQFSIAVKTIGCGLAPQSRDGSTCIAYANFPSSSLPPILLFFLVVARNLGSHFL